MVVIMVMVTVIVIRVTILLITSIISIITVIITDIIIKYPLHSPQEYFCHAFASRGST